MDLKTLVRTALEIGRAEYLAGRISALEALSRPTLENAVLYWLDQGILIEDAKRLRLGPAVQSATEREALAERIGSFLSR
jgi:glycerol-3-phosphate O-acyltransferase